MIRMVLPFQLRALAQLGVKVQLEVEGRALRCPTRSCRGQSPFTLSGRFAGGQTGENGGSAPPLRAVRIWLERIHSKLRSGKGLGCRGIWPVGWMSFVEGPGVKLKEQTRVTKCQPNELI
jgi:hypothetical protein